MYRAKERGRGRYEFFDAGLRRRIAERLELTAALRRAIAEDGLDLVYQTRRTCGDRRVVGVEALLQWDHCELGRVEPTVFLPIAERSGQSVDVGEWALQRALSEVAALPDRAITVAVNVTPRQLTTSSLVRSVADALRVSGLEPSRLVLEITESALVPDPDTARSVLIQLRRLGVTIALDDFGTGWSALSYLRTLPVDIIKIDESFVADLTCDPDALAVVAAVLGLGHGMGLIVVAEGLEDAEQLAVLRDMGCDEYQGLIDGAPGPLHEVLSHPRALSAAG
jgi:EAL domain-containing protein (putative c-di-GMP-specific phosphodiesterase class I)